MVPQLMQEIMLPCTMTVATVIVTMTILVAVVEDMTIIKNTIMTTDDATFGQVIEMILPSINMTYSC